jgi:predicted metal-binding transcription factor (methanogenesis marker protein 9)
MLNLCWEDLHLCYITKIELKKENLNISNTKKRNNHGHFYLEKNYATMFLLLVWSCKYSSPLSL